MPFARKETIFTDLRALGVLDDPGEDHRWSMARSIANRARSSG